MEGLIFGILRYNNTRLSPNHIIYSDIIIIIIIILTVIIIIIIIIIII